MKKSIKVIIALFASVVVLGGGGLGVYFGIIQRNNDNSIKKQILSFKGISNEVVKQLEEEFKDLDYNDNDLTEFFNYLKDEYQIKLDQSRSKKSNLQNILDFYKTKKTFDLNKEKIIIKSFQKSHSTRKLYLKKSLKSNIKTSLENKFHSVNEIIPFKIQENVTTETSDSLSQIITKIINKWNEKLRSNSKQIPLWKNFETNENLLNLAKEINPQINSLSDIKDLNIEDLYQLNYDVWNKYYETQISSFTLIIDHIPSTTLNLFDGEKIKALISWLNHENNTAIKNDNNKENNIQAIVDYYKTANKSWLDANNQINDFKTFYNTRQLYLNKSLIDNIKTTFENKFTLVSEIIPFKNKENVVTKTSDSLSQIITKILSKWNHNLMNNSKQIPLWKNFEINQSLLNSAKEINPQINNLADIKILNTEALYQLHYDAWNDLYKKTIEDYAIPSIFNKDLFLTLPQSNQDTIKNKIYTKYYNNIEEFKGFMLYIGDKTNQIYQDVDGITLENNYDSKSAGELYNLSSNFIFKNYEQYTKQANNNLIDGIGVYKLFDRNNPTYKVFGLINYVNKTLDQLKDLEKNNPQEFFNLYRDAWIQKINYDINSYPKFLINRVVSANSLMQKDNPQTRNNRNFFCGYTMSRAPKKGLITRYNWENPFLNRQNEVDDIIVCALLELPPASTPKVSDLNNEFPLIIFNNINSDLANKGVDPTKGLTTEREKKEALLNLEEKAKKAAKVIADSLLENLSFAGEFVNLDTITFNISNGEGISGVHTEVFKDSSVEPFYSSRTIGLFFQRKTKINEGVTIYTPGYVPFNKEELKDISFDLYELFETLAHEYGHHVTLQNGLIDSQKFLDELDKVFYGDASNQSYNDFREMYKYFNSMNIDSSLNFRNNLNGVQLNIGAKNTLKLFRKYYSYNVRTVYDLVYGDLFAYHSSPKRNLEEIITSLNYWKFELKENPTLRNYINDLKTYEIKMETNVVVDENEVQRINEIKEKIKSYYLTYYDRNSVVTSINHPIDGTIKPSNRGLFPVVYGYVPDSFDLDSDRSPQLQIKDIFPNLKATDWYTNQEIANLDVLELGYNFHGNKNNYEENNLGTFLNEEQFKNASINADKRTLKDLQYYFSTNELLARMYSVLTHKNFDNRKFIPQSTFDSQSTTFNRKPPYLNNKTFSDYGFYRSFGMNLLEGDNEITLYKILTQRDDLSNNQGYIMKNNIRNPSDNTEDLVPYSLSLRVVDPNGNAPQGWSNVHLIVDLKLENPEDAFLLKFAYKVNQNASPTIVSPYNYDYYNSFVIVNNEDENIESVDNNHLTSIYSSSSEAKKHVTLVFPLWKISGIVRFNEYKRIWEYATNPLHGRKVNYDTLKDIFSWDDASKPILFIDKNNDNIQDENDIVIPFS